MMIYLSTAIGLTPGGSTVHIYTQTIHRTTHWKKQYIEQQIQNNNRTTQLTN